MVFFIAVNVMSVIILHNIYSISYSALSFKDIQSSAIITQWKIYHVIGYSIAMKVSEIE